VGLPQLLREVAPASHAPRLAAIERAARRAYAAMAPTPQVAWPLVARRAGTEVWVKHENHTPTGAFRVRGGLNLVAGLLESGAPPPGSISATRGNHGQSLAYATPRHGLRCTIVVPHGNSRAKNEAMRALGAELIEHGRDFDEARVHAHARASERGLAFVGPFETALVEGVATYALELFRGAPRRPRRPSVEPPTASCRPRRGSQARVVDPLRFAQGPLADAATPPDLVYAPIGCGSGICGLIAARDALGLSTAIVGVVSTAANAYAQSLRGGRIVETASANTMADGMAVRVPVPAAFEIIRRGAEDIVEVDDDAVRAAMRALFDDTHQIAEGAGAAPLAALLADPRRTGRRCAVVLSGGNVDRDVYAQALAG
jgi:threonine dehydratase